MDKADFPEKLRSQELRVMILGGRVQRPKSTGFFPLRFQISKQTNGINYTEIGSGIIPVG